ncbi:MAG: hypothetical protein ISS48_00470 [Candidatus Aenigmarchaeota archaeon]|nr:hypothetical protein [Candidatus Aenigmarchaeota archaeon]
MFCRKTKWGEKIFAFLLGLIVIISAISWIGNDIGWWQINFPFWPLIALLIGIAILIEALKH